MQNKKGVRSNTLHQYKDIIPLYKNYVTYCQGGFFSTF